MPPGEQINPVTGDAEGSGFDSTSKTTVQFHNGLVLNYGFHDVRIILPFLKSNVTLDNS